MKIAKPLNQQQNHIQRLLSESNISKKFNSKTVAAKKIALSKLTALVKLAME